MSLWPQYQIASFEPIVSHSLCVRGVRVKPKRNKWAPDSWVILGNSAAPVQLETVLFHAGSFKMNADGRTITITLTASGGVGNEMIQLCDTPPLRSPWKHSKICRFYQNIGRPGPKSVGICCCRRSWRSRHFKALRFASFYIATSLYWTVLRYRCRSCRKVISNKTTCMHTNRISSRTKMPKPV